MTILHWTEVRSLRDTRPIARSGSWGDLVAAISLPTLGDPDDHRAPWKYGRGWIAARLSVKDGTSRRSDAAYAGASCVVIDVDGGTEAHATRALDVLGGPACAVVSTWSDSIPTDVDPDPWRFRIVVPVVPEIPAAVFRRVYERLASRFEVELGRLGPCRVDTGLGEKAEIAISKVWQSARARPDVEHPTWTRGPWSWLADASTPLDVSAWIEEAQADLERERADRERSDLERARLRARARAPEGGALGRRVRSRVERAIEKVARAGSGERNGTLYGQARWIGRHPLEAAGMSIKEVEADLLGACRTNGLVDDDGERPCWTTIARGLRDGMSDPLDPREIAPDVHVGRRVARDVVQRIEAAEDPKRVVVELRADIDAMADLGAMPEEEWESLVAELEARGAPEASARDLRRGLRKHAKRAPKEPREAQAIAVHLVSELTLGDACDLIMKAVRGAQDDRGDPLVYGRGASLVRVDHQTDRSGGFLRRITHPDELATIATRGANWIRMGRDGETLPAPPPRAATTAALHERAVAWKLPPIRGVVPLPWLTAEGEIVDQPGYHAASGLYLDDHGLEIDVPVEPSMDEAIAARDVLLGVVSEVPWAGAGEALQNVNAASFVAAVLTGVAIPSHGGASPMALVQANTIGAGKTRLARLISLIATGRTPGAASWTANDEENRKQLDSAALAGSSCVFFDNVRARLGGATLEAFLTSTRVTVRPLGVSHVDEISWRPMWIATANNPSVTSDLADRCLSIRLDAPENAREVVYRGAEDPESIVRPQHGRLLSAALTMLRFAQQHPELSAATPWSSFSSWDRLVRRAVLAVGMQDPRIGARELRDLADSDSEGIGIILGAIHAYWGDQPWMARDLLDVMRGAKGAFYDDQETEKRREALRDAIAMADWPEHIGRVGAKLRSIRDVPVRGLVLRRVEERIDRTTPASAWAVEKA